MTKMVRGIGLALGLMIGVVMAQPVSTPSALQEAEAKLAQKQAEYAQQMEAVRKENVLFGYAEQQSKIERAVYGDMGGARRDFAKEQGKSAQRLKMMIGALALSEVLEDEKEQVMYKTILASLDPYRRRDFFEMILSDGTQKHLPEGLDTTDFDAQWTVFLKAKAERKPTYLSRIDADAKKQGIADQLIESVRRATVSSCRYSYIYEPYIALSTPQQTRELRSEISKLIHEISRLKAEPRKPRPPQNPPVVAVHEEEIAVLKLKIAALEEKRTAQDLKIEQASYEVYRKDPELLRVYEATRLQDKEREALAPAKEKYDAWRTTLPLPYKTKHEYGALMNSVVYADLYEADADFKQFSTYLFQSSPSIKQMKKGMEKKIKGSLLTFSKDRDSIIKTYYKRMAAVRKGHEKRISEIERQYDVPQYIPAYFRAAMKCSAYSSVYGAYLSRHLYQGIGDQKNPNSDDWKQIQSLKNQNSEDWKQLQVLKRELSSLEGASK